MPYKCDNCNMSISFVTADYQDRIDAINNDLVKCCSNNLNSSLDKKNITINMPKPTHSKSSSTKLFIDKSELSNNS